MRLRRTLRFGALVTAMAMALPCTLLAAVQPNALFSDHAVLQRNHPIPVWGTSSPKAKIVVQLDKNEITTVSDEAGHWRAVLPAMPAGGPYTLTISGDGEVDLHDIMVGEVWLAAGQSNMAFPLKRALDSSAAIAASENPNIRMFKVHSVHTEDPTLPQTNISGTWELAGPKTSPEFSAVAWFFAQRIQKELQVSVGIINNSVGGSPAEAWTSRVTLESDPLLASVMNADLLRLQQGDVKKLQYEKDLADWQEANHTKDPGGSASPFVATDLDTSDWKKTSLPAKASALGLKSGAVVWLRIETTLDPDPSAAEASIHFGKLGESYVLFVNGEKVGGYTGIHNPAPADVTFTFPASAFRSGPNSIAVRVFSQTLQNEDFGSVVPAITDGKNSALLKGTWSYKVSFEGPVLSEAAQRSVPAYKDVNKNQVSILLYNQLLVPLSDYAIRGVLWYQGEQNLTDPVRYQDVLPKMIADWRRQWHEDIPFYIVQLPNLGLASPGVKGHLPLIREVQANVANSIGNSGYVVTMDVGDPHNIHPTNKHPVGDRLADLALARTYGKSTEYTGPVPSKVIRKQGAIEIDFAHAEGGLVTRNGLAGGFMIAGQDHVLVPAVATVNGSSVTVSSPSVTAPEAVFYGWVDNPVDANLYNHAGLPAAPFRTDRLPIP